MRGALGEISQGTIEIIKRSYTAKDFEATIESAVAGITIASIRLITRRLARA